MSESAEKTPTFGGALPAGTYLGPSSDDPTKAGPTTNAPAQIFLEALQSFVIPLIQTAKGENKKDIGQVHSMGPEAGKLLTALQQFISSMIAQSQVGQPQGIEVNLNGPDVDSVSSEDASVGSLSVAPESNVSDPGPSIEMKLEPTEYQRFMGIVQEAVREHVFSKMPIRLLHFAYTPRDPGAKLPITLLDRNDVCGRILQKIQATSFTERNFEERLEMVTQYHRSDWGYEIILGKDVVREVVQQNTKYAILSHTWLRGSKGEVTYGAWRLGQFDPRQPGYQKLANFCRSAWKDHGLSFGWMDTVCINKDSSSELDESIRSMYKWYKNSNICITYLAETIALGHIHQDPWFTRGWTFQELLAPACMSFYNKDWKSFIPYIDPGDKYNQDIENEIFKATTITHNELRISNYLPVSRKMQLAATRNVMREEDIAYSLMGICSVSISIAYGEGAERAFFRLMTEVLNTSSDAVDIFNCAQKSHRSSIIPSGPSAYLRRSKDITRIGHDPPIEPLLLTHVGLRTPILLMPSSEWSQELRNSRFGNDPIGDYCAMLQLPESLYSKKLISFYLLRKKDAKSIRDRRRTFGVLNFAGNSTTLRVRDLCLAICFEVDPETQVEWGTTSSMSMVKWIGTHEPIVFHLLNRKISTPGKGEFVYSIKRSELAKHGMTLTTMYL